MKYFVIIGNVEDQDKTHMVVQAEDARAAQDKFEEVSLADYIDDNGIGEEEADDICVYVDLIIECGTDCPSIRFGY